METEEANAKARNKEALLTAGMGYGKRKRESLAAFWSIVWPRLEKIGWKQVVGSGNDEGAITFLPPVIAFTKSGKHCPPSYDKIKSVLDRLEESANEEEGKTFSAFRDAVPVEPEPLAISRPKRGTRRPRLGVSVSRPVEDDSEIDISWKDGGSLYPKRSSQVGSRHQVSFLPPAGSIDTEKKSEEPQYDVVWDWKKAAEKGVLDFVEKNVPANKKEKALQHIHDSDYSISNANEFVDQIHQSNLSAWTEKDKEKYHVEIFRCRKNFEDLCKRMGDKDMGDIIAYYLGQYKRSDDYRLLKTVRVQERIEKAEQSNHHVDQCAICGEGGNLLICDGCESEWHMECSKPALKTVPEGHWECDVCIDRKFLECRKRILEATKSNMMSLQRSRKRKLDQDDMSSKETHKTDAGLSDKSSGVLDALKLFSANIDAILTKPSVA